jgi:hypothetical protein
LIAPNYLSTEADRRVAADSLRLTRRIAEGRQMPLPAAGIKPGIQLQSDELARLAGSMPAPPSSIRWAPARWGAWTTGRRWWTATCGRGVAGAAGGGCQRDAQHHQRHQFAHADDRGAGVPIGCATATGAVGGPVGQGQAAEKRCSR